MKYCFGIDVGGTTVKMGLFEKRGVLVDKWEIKTDTSDGGKNILPDIVAAIEDKIKERDIKRDSILGIGMGIPAPVQEDGSVPMTANLGWGYKAVKREMEALIGIYTKVGNDANVAALGEQWQGGGRGNSNMVMVTLGTGVGGGIIINNHIVVGANGSGGEIGHMCVNYEETDACGCGCKGCLEQYASATGITKLANRRLKKDDMPTMLRNQPVNAKEVFDAVKAGDAVAKEIAEEFGNYLGHALANIAILVDPSAFVIGGGVSKAGKILFDYICPAYKDRAFVGCKNVKFALAELGNDAGIYGAAKLVLE